MRFGDMVDALRKLATLASWPSEKLEELSELFRQIQTLKIVRDDVAHRVWAVCGNEMSFSNFHTSRREDSAEFAIYTIAELNELARYAPVLSIQALDLFPETMPKSGQPPSRPIPARLRKIESKKDAVRRISQEKKRQRRSLPT